MKKTSVQKRRPSPRAPEPKRARNTPTRPAQALARPPQTFAGAAVPGSRAPRPARPRPSSRPPTSSCRVPEVALHRPPAAARARTPAAGEAARDLLRRGEHEPARAHQPRDRSPRGRLVGLAHRSDRRRQLEGDRPRHRASPRPSRRASDPQRAVGGRERLERSADRRSAAGVWLAGARPGDVVEIISERPGLRRGRRRGGEPRHLLQAAHAPGAAGRRPLTRTTVRRRRVRPPPSGRRVAAAEDAGVAGGARPARRACAAAACSHPSVSWPSRRRGVHAETVGLARTPRRTTRSSTSCTISCSGRPRAGDDRHVWPTRSRLEGSAALPARHG